MKITNFKDMHTVSPISYATITVTTGLLWWKKTVDKAIFRPNFCADWRFIDNGQFTPRHHDVNAMSVAYEARQTLSNALSKAVQEKCKATESDEMEEVK